MQKLVHQTLLLSCCHFIVRIIGFVMRIWLSRELGTLAMGIVELAQSAQMLLITPVVSGLPSAISRMCAKEDARGCQRVLHAGILLALAASIPPAAIAFLFRQPLSLWLGDLRTLPALLVFLPCLPVLGVSCALNGYFYGIGKPVPPALSELLEQIVRFFLSMRLVSLLGDWPVMLRAAIPAAGALAGETAGLALMLLFSLRVLFIRMPGQPARSGKAILKEMLSLALPLTGMRMVTSLMRTVTSTLLPKRLVLSGLPAGEALSQLGIMQGMMMPLLLLPSFVTCSLAAVAAPELARRQAQGRPLSSLARRSMSAALGIGLAAMAGVWLFAPLFAQVLYRQAELLPMLRRSCALIPVMAMTHVAGGLMNGLGLQTQSLRISVLSGFVCVLLTYILPALPALRIDGAIIALAGGQAITLGFSLSALHRAISRECTSQ
ncbi:MAG: oligosaccharide flippase family protein [Clostridia bacterium]|nr:oligosaccharide flippase family protein [Clostridia bacterium]